MMALHVQRKSPAPGDAPGPRRWWRSSTGTGTSAAPAHGAGCMLQPDPVRPSRSLVFQGRTCGLCSDRNSRQQVGARDTLA
jgi:hypothetical protein